MIKTGPIRKKKPKSRQGGNEDTKRLIDKRIKIRGMLQLSGQCKFCETVSYWEKMLLEDC